jgi:hypothetical protein
VDIKPLRSREQAGRLLGAEAFVATHEEKLGENPEEAETWPEETAEEFGLVSPEAQTPRLAQRAFGPSALDRRFTDVSRNPENVTTRGVRLSGYGRRPG